MQRELSHAEGQRDWSKAFIFKLFAAAGVVKKE